MAWECVGMSLNEVQGQIEVSVRRIESCITVVDVIEVKDVDCGRSQEQ